MAFGVAPARRPVSTPGVGMTLARSVDSSSCMSDAPKGDMRIPSCSRRLS